MPDTRRRIASRLWCLAALLLPAQMHLARTSRAADLPGPWVSLASDGGLDVRSVIAPGMTCPNVAADGAALASTRRGTPDESYPVELCLAHTHASARAITVEGLPAPVLPPTVRRIVVIGDTGCRLKGAFTQACNDPVQWPFARVARLAAARRPDLVIHVGDYHYRESPCPSGQPGCAGSPYGDNWQVWKRDFFDPAAPLLAAAPWVLVRGNHELCQRGGHGWFRLLDPHVAAGDCVDTSPPYRLRIGGLGLLLLDSADADDKPAQPNKVAFYRDQLRTLLSDAPPGSWLLTHRPVWALAQGEGVPVGAISNATEQAAIRGQVPPALDLVLSGHVHDFAGYDYGSGRPAQLVVGESGTRKDPIVQPVTAGIAVDGMPIQRAMTLSHYGYVVLERAGQDWTVTVYALTDEVLARCRLRGRALRCDANAR